MLGNPAFDFINDLMLERQFLFLRVVDEAQFNLQVLFEVIFLVEIESVLILERGELFLLGDDKVLHLLEARIVKPKGTRQVVVAQFVGYIGFLALLDLENENLFCVLYFRDQRLQHHDAFHCLQINHDFQFLVGFQDFVFLQVIANNVTVVD